MTKHNLTKEAQDHLADLLKIKLFDEGVFYKWEDKGVHREDFRPHDLDSPYGGKYLRDLLGSLNQEQTEMVEKEWSYHGGLFFTFTNSEFLVEIILEVTGFTGEVWE